MAIRQLQYAKELERLLADGVGFDEAHRIAAELSEVKKTSEKKGWYEPLKKRFLKLYKKVEKYSPTITKIAKSSSGLYKKVKK